MMPPSPPGDTIRDIMDELDINQRDLGRLLYYSDNDVKDLLSGKMRIHKPLANALSEVLGSTPEFWLNRDNNYVKALEERK